MRRLKSVSGFLGMALAFAGALWAQGTDSLGLAKNASGENYLVDSKGMTLYYYTKDDDGQSACNGNCLKAWPAFYAPSVSVSAPLTASDFGTITRSDGSRQTTYMGWPLYYWMNDKQPGDITGDGVGKVWYLLKVPAYTVMLSTSKTLGNYLVDGKGMTLYWFTKDSPGTSDGSGKANPNWPAFDPSGFIVPSALAASDFKTIVRGDGTKQATYKGYPLYYFVKDLKRGDTLGQDIGKAWYVIDPAQFPITSM